VLIIVHPDTSARVADIEAIRTAWRARSGAQSVLRVSHAVDVSF
jgi:hypothetical protein